MKTRVMVNRDAIAKNKKLKEAYYHVIVAESEGGGVTSGKGAIVRDAEGNEVGRFVYNPRARKGALGTFVVYFETELEVELT